MNALISVCGLNCETCEARIATVNNDDELRKETAEKWQKMFNSLKPVWLAVPATIGAVIGAYVAVDVSQRVIEWAMTVAMVMMVFFLFYKPRNNNSTFFYKLFD